MNMCQLKDCGEGYMGKLRIRESGKTELVLGDNVMEVLPAIPINFHQVGGYFVVLSYFLVLLSFFFKGCLMHKTKIIK